MYSIRRRIPLTVAIWSRSLGVYTASGLPSLSQCLGLYKSVVSVACNPRTVPHELDTMRRILFVDPEVPARMAQSM